MKNNIGHFQTIDSDFDFRATPSGWNGTVPGTILPLKVGDTWGAKIKFLHFGAAETVIVYAWLNIKGYEVVSTAKEVACGDDFEWKEYGPYDVSGTITTFYGLGKDRRIDAFKKIMQKGTGKTILEDKDAEIYYVAQEETPAASAFKELHSLYS